MAVALLKSAPPSTISSPGAARAFETVRQDCAFHQTSLSFQSNDFQQQTRKHSWKSGNALPSDSPTRKNFACRGRISGKFTSRGKNSVDFAPRGKISVDLASWGRNSVDSASRGRISKGFASRGKRSVDFAVMAAGAASNSSASLDSDSRSSEDSKHVVVCGAGVIGACTALFLARKGARVTVVEKTGVACAASGKAGGFLALDWSDGSSSGDLARASFKLHAQLADELDGASYGYRRVGALSVRIEEDSGSKGSSGRTVPGWVDGGAKTASSIGSTATTAQVHPELFTKKILSVAMEDHGAELVTGDAQEVKVEAKGGKNCVTGVVVSGNFIAADAVVLAMGPWSSTNTLLTPLTRISPLKAHSIVLRPKEPDAITAECLFLNYRTKEGKSMDPEVYPRPSGDVYLCGMSEEVQLPADASQIFPRKEAMAMLQRVATTVSSKLADAELTHEQACFLPCSEDGLPVIGQIPDVAGAYVATGHSCWGILNAPATGASLAELIMDGASKLVNLRAFDPSRFSNISSRLRAFMR